MAERPRGIPDAELFMSRPSDNCDSPTVEPLRIFKPQSASPPSTERFRYPPPQSHATSSVSASSSPAPAPNTTGRLAFPLPPGASSSAAPLPYPDDDYPFQFHQTHQTTYQSPRINLSPVSTGDKKPGLAERRGTGPAALSPTSPTDSDDLFAKPISKPASYYPAANANVHAYRPSNDTDTLKMAVVSEDHGVASGQGGQGGMNRFASTASTSTTRASRGSPPPPETPIVEPGQIPGGDIEARYAASGISGTATLNSLHGPSVAAAQRLAQYGSAPAAQSSTPPVAGPARPWTPTESPENQPHGPPTVYHGMSPVQSVQSPVQSVQSPVQSVQGVQNVQSPVQNVQSPVQTVQSVQNVQSPVQNVQSQSQVSVLEQDFQRMQASTPPPAYTSVNPSASYPPEKTGRLAQAGQAVQSQSQSAQPAQSVQSVQSGQSTKPAQSATTKKPESTSVLTGHPAFANDANANDANDANDDDAEPSSPPPLPEGWIAHLDQNSGQYYYIHLATQATQWEFPKGPTPLNHEAAPLSPATSTYGNPLASPFPKTSLASPMYPPTPGYAESITSVAASTTTGFMGPPPGAGVDMYKVAPTNGVYFGPYLRYTNMDVEQGVWLGSILVVSDAPQPPTIHVHRSVDLSPNPRQLMPRTIHTHQRWAFLRYDLDLPMGDAGTERWTYAVTSHLGCTRYEFVVAGRHEQGWRFLAHSGNDFSPLTSQAERTRLGGVDVMWKDVLQKNVDCGGFHVQLGVGDQIYADRLWREVPLLQQWLAISGRENRRGVQWTARHEEDVTHAYFHYYTSHFDQPFLREAFAQIPHVLQINDHDIFDGFGSYPAYMQQTPVFKNIGRIAMDMYLLFQHHTTIEVLRNVHSDQDLFTITGSGWHFVKYLGPAMVVVGPDCRSERTQTRVLAGPTYQGLFPKVAMLPPSVQHCLWMLSVPVVYPRMDSVETLANTFQTGKKAVNTTYNILGKVTSSVAGVVGGRDVVQHGFSSVKKAIGKSGLMGSVLNNFGEIGISEELRDLWTHDSKDLERTYLIRTLQGIAAQKGIRMTFLSGDVHCCGAGLVHDPAHPSDHKTMYQLITSPIVGAPSPSYLLKMLHNNKLLYVPVNGQSTTNEASDTKEDMMEIFQVDVSGGPREHKKLMNRRNYLAIVAYDPDAAAGAAGATSTTYATSVHGQHGLCKLSLAVDYIVQGDAFGATKYGPVIVPHLEFGH